MKALVQRVSRASVRVDGATVGAIGGGLLVLAGFGRSDTNEDLLWTAGRIANLRIFPDDRGAMNLSLLDTGGSILLVSQFTLHADTAKGRRPGFARAADPVRAEMLFRLFASMLEDTGLEVQRGVFGAMMEVELVNDGPVTIMIDSPCERVAGA
ncbi:D-tyrosyl-tRNA(Tyr) deacylase [Candidatus Fermentibacteria bacterium]|nr:D-tyrosyl-tRNA(Tyr) deacylase [Candidatus Fermentibacteria bacterium]